MAVSYSEVLEDMLDFLRSAPGSPCSPAYCTKFFMAKLAYSTYYLGSAVCRGSKILLVLNTLAIFLLFIKSTSSKEHAVSILRHSE